MGKIRQATLTTAWTVFPCDGSSLGLEGISIGALAGVYGNIDGCGVPVIAQIRTFFARDICSPYTLEALVLLYKPACFEIPYIQSHFIS